MGGKRKNVQKKEEEVEQEEHEKEAKEETDPKELKVVESKFEAIPPKKVSYCPVCTMPFELCKYGRTVGNCIAFLYGIAPTKVVKYHPDFKEDQVETLLKAVPTMKDDDQKPAKEGKNEGKGDKSVRSKFIVIDVKSRGKKQFVTSISGLANFNIDTKEMAKKVSKKYALSCSAVEEGLQMQGDNLQNIREFLKTEYGIKGKYILTREEFNEKHGQQVAKKKQMKKVQEGTIVEKPGEEDEKVETAPDKNALRQVQYAQSQDPEPEDD